MATKKTTQLYGVLGYPAKHSLSPYMHNAAFKALKIDAKYKIFEVEPSELSKFMSSLVKSKIHGLNVTVPYKQRVCGLIDKVSAEAQLIGAVNTIKVSRGEFQGYNTDGQGFLDHLRHDLKFDPAGKNIVVIGAGGASRAVCLYLCETKPKRLAIFNRDRSKTITLFHHLNTNFSRIEFVAASSIEQLDILKADLLVNTTSVGMKEQDLSLVEEQYLHKDLLVYDLVYNVAQTKLLKLAEAKGARVSNGLGMLLYQGMASFKIWTGRSAPKEIMYEALKRAVGK
jgi:shikimate dehydrogenase